MPSVTDLISNPIDLVSDRPYGAILGLSPSQGARSPLLWRAAFKALNLEADFHPFDVTPDALESVVQALKADSRFIGGAIAVPHKELILPFLDEVEPAAQAIGAVNALRRSPEGKIVGSNTDGLAAVDCLESIAGKVEGKKMLVLGLGGAGKAVATSFAFAGVELSVWNRDFTKCSAFSEKLASAQVPVTAVSNLAEAFYNTDFLVNCTSAGFSSDGSENDDAPFELSLVGRLPDHAVVYDIIYQPLQTALLKASEQRGLSTLNGKSMNFGQAVLAFCLAYPKVDRTAVETAMAAV